MKTAVISGQTVCTQNDAIDGNVFQIDTPDYLDLYLLCYIVRSALTFNRLHGVTAIMLVL